jgi:hypothetical protein
MQIAFNFKNERKLLRINCCLLFSKVFGVPLLVLSSTAAAHKYCGKVEGKEAQVKSEMRTPAHMPEDASAGAGDAGCKTQQHQPDVTAEHGQQQQRKPQARSFRRWKQEQPGCQQFRYRHQVNQRFRNSFWDALVQHFPPEAIEVSQFADGSISIQQDQQRGNKGGKDFFHGHPVCCQQSKAVAKSQNSMKWVAYPFEEGQWR